MPRRRVSWLVLALILSATGCSSSGQGELVVDVRTDYRPGLDFVRIDTTVAREDGTVEQEASTGDDRCSAAAPRFECRAAELEGVSTGSKRVVVSLVARNGDVVAEHPVRADVVSDGTLIVVNIYSRCRDVTCAEGEICRGGGCVPEECDDRADAECGVCTFDDDCRSAVACAESGCVEGACWTSPDDSECEGDDVCSPLHGCRPPAGGDMDGGTCDCVGRACGPDGCGGSCGSCTAPEACLSGECQCQDLRTDAEVCGTRECGSVDDNCGVARSCGSCTAPDVCVSGACECRDARTDAEVCGTRECGSVADNCGVERPCGSCPPDSSLHPDCQPTCSASGECVAPSGGSCTESGVSGVCMSGLCSCSPTGDNLCFHSGRFDVRQSGLSAGNQSSESGYLVAGPGNAEVAMQILDPPSWSSAYWVFYDRLSSFEQSFTITDMHAGHQESYSVTSGCADESTADFTWPASGTCTPSATVMCLQGYEITVDGSETGVVASSWSKTGAFYFFGESNWEVPVKILEYEGSTLLFWGRLTSVDTVNLHVTDPGTGTTRTYTTGSGCLGGSDLTTFCVDHTQTPGSCS